MPNGLISSGLPVIINVKVTLDDPFVMLSQQAIATGTGTDSGTETGTGTSELKFTAVNGFCTKSIYCIVNGEQKKIQTSGTRDRCVLDENGSTDCSETYCNAEDPVCP